MSQEGQRQVLGPLTSAWDDPMVEKFHDGVKPMMHCTYCNELTKREWVCNPTKLTSHLVGSSGEGISKCKNIPSLRKQRHQDFLSGKTQQKEERIANRTVMSQQIDNLQDAALEGLSKYIS